MPKIITPSVETRRRLSKENGGLDGLFEVVADIEVDEGDGIDGSEVDVGIEVGVAFIGDSLDFEVPKFILLDSFFQKKKKKRF